MEKICDEKKCTGCKTCVNVCPKQAIELYENEYGVLLPVVDEEKCINCGICQRSCQANEIDSLNYPQKCYAVWSKNKEDRALCSSGGLSTGFGRKVIQDGGVVFGAAYCKDFCLEICKAENEEQLKDFRGSKYVQCDTAGSYQCVKDCLEEGRKVLYVATPCQVMGLRKYLKKEYKNLILVDIICHGVPPFRHLKEHVKYLCKNKSITKVTFRGEHDFKLTVYDKDRILYCRDKIADTYFTAFLDGLNYRENCYSCQFARIDRGSDITIGDFWGLKREDLKQLYNGRISVALVNTEKGADFFDSVKESFYYEERTVQEAMEGNEQLHNPTRRHPNRDKFLETYRNEGLEQAYRAAGVTQKIKTGKWKSNICIRILKKFKKIII